MLGNISPLRARPGAAAKAAMRRRAMVAWRQELHA
jgi:hypothetical protein